MDLLIVELYFGVTAFILITLIVKKERYELNKKLEEIENEEDHSQVIPAEVLAKIIEQELKK